MKSLVLSFSCWIIVGLAASVQAQHVHSVPHTTTHFDTYRHGNHYHTVPHTTTHYHQYWHNGPDYLRRPLSNYGYSSNYLRYPSNYLSYPSYYSSGYSSGLGLYSSGLGLNLNIMRSPYGLTSPYNSLSSPGYLSSGAAPSVVIVPQATAGAAIAANRIPVGASAPSATPASARVITLTNPPETNGSITYALNSYTYTIQPGESQTLTLDRQWTIRFDNGLGKQVAYRLSEGDYQFTVSAQGGWNVTRVFNSTNPTPATPTAPAAPRPGAVAF